MEKLDVSALELCKVLPPTVEQCYTMVEEFLENEGVRHYTIFCSTPLPALFDVTKFPNAEDYTSIRRKDIQTFVVSLCVFVPQKIGGLYLILLDENENSYGNLSKVTGAFRRSCAFLEIPLCYRDLGDRDKVSDFLFYNTHYHSDESVLVAEHKAARDAANRASNAELWLLKNLRYSLGLDIDEQKLNYVLDNLPESESREFYQAAAYDGVEYARRHFRVYHEFSLSRLAARPKGVPAYKGGSEAFGKLYDRRCDALVAAPPPYSLPLLVVEFDGPHHCEGDQIIKDMERDYVLNGLGIPVLRVLCGTRNPSSKWTEREKRCIDLREDDIRASEVFIGYIARALSSEQHRIWRSNLRQRDCLLSLSEALVVEAATHDEILGNRQRINEVQNRYEELYEKSGFERDLDELIDADEELSVGLDAGAVARISKGAAHLENITVEWLNDSIKVVRARADLVCQAGNRKVETPEFHVDLRAVELKLGIADRTELYERAATAAIVDRSILLYQYLIDNRRL